MRFAHVCVALVLLIAAAVPAAPILSAKRKIADHHRSLSGLIEVSVHVWDLQNRVKGLGIRKTKTEQFLREQLEDSGFKIVTDTEAPRCILRIVTNVDERFPDAVSVGTMLEIEQRVTVHRVQEDLTVATAVIVDVFLTHRNDAWKDVQKRITLCVAYLANTVGRASEG